jgi:hypothetical protein
MIASPYRHTLCWKCYAAMEPGRTPSLVRDAPPGSCCRCNEIADPPIFYRYEAKAFGCNGVHHEPDEEADA